MLAAGDSVPSVTVFDDARKPVDLPELAADGPVLFLFYLFDWSGTWTNEFELLRDRKHEFDAAGVRVFGISRDSPWTHIAWSQALDLNVPLLSDWNADALRAFGIAREWRGMGDVAERSAYLVERGGTVRRVWRYEATAVPDFDELLAAARALPSSA